MKKLLSFTIVTFLTALIACTPNEQKAEDLEKDTNLSTNTLYFSQAYLKELYINVGQVHNQKLEEFYNYLKGKHNKATYQISSTEINEVVFDITLDNESVLPNEEDFYIINSALLDENLTFKTQILELTNIEISKELNAVTREIKKLIYNSWDIADLDEKFDHLLKQSLPQLSSELERFVLVSMTSVAKGSCKYWKQNGDKWLDLREPNRIMARGNGWTDAAWADAVGAGVGAIRGAAIGLTGGTVAVPGLGTAVGGAGGVMVGMITGAIGGSVAEGLHSIAKWAIGWD